jgi:hypothetical protein
MAIHAVPAVPRLLALMALAVLSTATVALASGRDSAPAVPREFARPAAAPSLLVVPDVRGQAHVFAKVLLEEAGFAWRVSGPVQGYAAHVVVRQFPAAGAEVIDTGQPTIVLELSLAPEREVRGRPENSSSYAGSPAYVVRRELASPDRMAVAR